MEWAGSTISEEKVMAKKRFRKARIVLSFIILMTFLAVFYVQDKVGPVIEDSKVMVELEIPLNTSVKEIAAILERENLIKDDKFFYYYTRLKRENDFKAGNYFLSRGMTSDEIILQLKEGKVYATSTKVIIPEGYTVDQIADVLAEEGLIDKNTFNETIETGNFDDIYLTREIPNKEGRTSRLEGFLFPKTYDFKEGITEEEIIRTMLKQTEKEIPSEWFEEAKKKGWEFYDVMVLASIIERETIAATERNKVAQVYYNRLKQNMRLQADATVQYALGKQKERLLYKDLEVDSPYNTYRHYGLPLAPIANPGLKSIEAALFPEEHDFLFYVTKKDGSGEHYFSKTYQEHLQNIEKSKKNE